MASFRQGDVAVTNLAASGLFAPSMVRTAKIVTIETSDAARLGKVSVPGNWRITFGFVDGDAIDVNLEDHH